MSWRIGFGEVSVRGFPMDIKTSSVSTRRISISPGNGWAPMLVFLAWIQPSFSNQGVAGLPALPLPEDRWDDDSMEDFPLKSISSPPPEWVLAKIKLAAVVWAEVVEGPVVVEDHEGAYAEDDNMESYVAIGASLCVGLLAVIIVWIRLTRSSQSFQGYDRRGASKASLGQGIPLSEVAWGSPRKGFVSPGWSPRVLSPLAWDELPVI